MTPFQRVMAIRTGGNTERCHGIRHVGSYSVGLHSWNVAMLMLVLWPGDFPRLVTYCLTHDIPEAWVGDIPAPTKRYCPEIKTACNRMEDEIFLRLNLSNGAALPKEDRAKLKACDHLELYLWAREQTYGGNMHADCVRRELERFFLETPLPWVAHELYEVIKAGVTEYATDNLIKELNRG